MTHSGRGGRGKMLAKPGFAGPGTKMKLEDLFHSTFLPSWRTLAAPTEASDGGNAGSVHGGNAGSVHGTPRSF